MMDIVFIGLQVHTSFSVYCTCNSVDWSNWLLKVVDIYIV